MNRLNETFTSNTRLTLQIDYIGEKPIEFQKIKLITRTEEIRLVPS